MKSIYDKISKSRKTGKIEVFIKERRADCVISTMPIKDGIRKITSMLLLMARLQPDR